MPTKEKPQSKKVEVVQSPRYASIYADNVQAVTRFTGLSLFFGEVVTSDEDALVVERHFKVSMSPEHAAALYKLLGEQLRSYEEHFGPIREVREPKS